ncbi:hypothetical protein BC831DRAFT_121945 [Entophlyctis helioformis]|nr:hypothetical protein BC831DRAFT_121945 [Entophlyctis helioformis]
MPEATTRCCSAKAASCRTAPAECAANAIKSKPRASFQPASSRRPERSSCAWSALQRTLRSHSWPTAAVTTTTTAAAGTTAHRMDAGSLEGIDQGMSCLTLIVHHCHCRHPQQPRNGKTICRGGCWLLASPPRQQQQRRQQQRRQQQEGQPEPAIIAQCERDVVMAAATANVAADQGRRHGHDWEATAVPATATATWSPS